MANMDQRLDVVGELCPIFRVPEVLRASAPEMYSPRAVSIGPLHNPSWNPHNPNAHIYQKMEPFKSLAWNIILQQQSHHTTNEPNSSRNPILKFTQALDQDKGTMLAASFGGRVGYKDLVDEGFVELIGIDACFVATILHCLFIESYPFLSTRMGTFEIDVANNLASRCSKEESFFPTFARKIPRPVQKAILEDLLLVENQIPLIALKHAVKLESKCSSDDEVDQLLELFVAALAHRVLPFSKSKKNVLYSVKKTASRSEHLLDMMYSIVCMHTDPSHYAAHEQHHMMFMDDDDDDEISSLGRIQHDPHHVHDMPGATRLYLSGVKLHGHWGSLNEISFDNGQLSIPKIHVDDGTERYFRNLIAYESCFKTNRLDIISYLHFMDYLIDTPADVDLLVDNKIITENIGSNEKVAEMWNMLCRNTMFVFNPKYQTVARSVQTYCRSRWRLMWAEFYRSKISKPWVLASIFSATALLVMTFLILWYTILLYHNGG